MRTNKKEEMCDLNTITRDDLRSLLSTAKDEWKKAINCEDDTENCKRLIAAEKRKKQAIEVKIEEYETQLLDLRKKEEEAMNKFDKVWFIPDDYCSEYAMTTMIKFIDSNKADSWKEVVALYDEHLYQMEMKENTRIEQDEKL